MLFQMCMTSWQVYLITEWNRRRRKKYFFTSPFVVNGIVGMQRARGNEVEYFHVSLERAERESLSL